MTSELIALDVAVLPPPDVAAKAMALNATLRAAPAVVESPLRLDAEHLPHITLMQLFARVNELEQVFAHVEETLRGVAPLSLRVTGGGQSTHTLWMAIEKTPSLMQLHERFMEALRGLDRPDGGTGAFFGDDVRLRDVLWVTGYRLKSSFHHFVPHITLGHGSAAPMIEPFTFEADTVAACQLGRHCTCRRVLRQWTLTRA